MKLKRFKIEYLKGLEEYEIIDEIEAVNKTIALLLFYTKHISVSIISFQDFLKREKMEYEIKKL